MLSKLIIAVFCCVLSVVPLAAHSGPSELERRRYAEGIQNAFDLQSKGMTRQAFYVFKDTYQAALKKGVPQKTLAPLEELFIWYRKYGYDSGVLAEPSVCQDEFHSSKENPFLHELDEHQMKMVRDFLYGVGSIVSGVLCITVGSPIAGKFGTSLVVGGAKCMFDAVNCMIEDHEKRMKRISELDKIAIKAINAIEACP